MTPFRVQARPYEIGSSVTSVELLLDARTRAEGACALAARHLASSIGVDGGVTVTATSPGPARWEGARKFVAEAPSGMLGALVLEDRTIGALADLVMGGRGIASDGIPSELEVGLFVDRALGFLHAILDAVAPGRPAPVALTERDYPTPARSMVVSIEVAHGEASYPMLVEVLAHHLADDEIELDDRRMQAICHDVPLELSFTYAPVRLSTQDVAALEPGDVICLDHAVDRPVVGTVGGRPVVRGRAGLSRRRVAVEVVDLVDGGED